MLARHLKRIYWDRYALGIIPYWKRGRLYSYNAARSLTTLVNEADNTFIFDNSAWKNEGESVKSAFHRLNNEVVRRFAILFRAGEVGRMGVGEMVVDSSEIINTLRGGGITSVGYAISDVISSHTKQQRGILGGIRENIKDTFGGKKEANERVLMGEDRSAKIVGLVRRAMLGRLTLPCDYSTAERALVLLPNRRMRWIEKAWKKPKVWVEENIAGVEVRGGDYPVNSEYVAAVVMLATVGNAPRIKELLDIAKETKEEVIKSKEKKSNMFEEGIEPLFE